MSLIPDTATFHQYLTISNGQIGFTPEARTSPYADHFYPPGWNIVPNRGVVGHNPQTVATWLMGTMPGMNGVSQNQDPVPATSPESRKRKICSVCSSTESKRFIKGQCPTCYQYQKQTNKPRPPTLNYQNREKKCSNCSSTGQSSYYKSLCNACHLYQQRTKTRRPPTVINECRCATCYQNPYTYNKACLDPKRVNHEHGAQ